MVDYSAGRGLLDGNEDKEKVDQGHCLNDFHGTLSHCCRASG